MIFEDMINRFKILIVFKDKLTQKGYNFKQLSYLNAQIELLNEFMVQEGLNLLNVILREKTNYRLLKHIDKGIENLVDISKYPNHWYLSKIDNCYDEWLNLESLIFSTERETLVFTKNDYEHGQKYINNKWQ
jgi:hypothetical protein